VNYGILSHPKQQNKSVLILYVETILFCSRTTRNMDRMHAGRGSRLCFSMDFT